jgi:eukaryotic-like serine/threonine-protein kinase
MTGLHLSHYAIEAELGRGGMGIVFRAKDTKLNRTVALKVLPAGALASEDDRARFRREAQAAAQLNHPNVCHVYEVDEAVPQSAEGKLVDGHTEPRLFIAMEYIAGETLHDYVKKGPLKLQEAVNIAGQVAEALKEAHAKDIVHRDIKSANIMLTDGGVAKVLDFGLAKTNQSTMLTRMGSTLGTVAYMSPEQARGQEVDGRSDLYSLGTVLYEMVAGRLPYSGDYEQAVLYGILNEPPEPLTGVRTGIPMQLEWLVNKLLAKEAEYRYQSAAGLLADLKSLDLTGSGNSMRSMPAAGAAGAVGGLGPLAPGLRVLPIWGWGLAVVTLLLGAAVAWFIKQTPATNLDKTVRTLILELPGMRSVGSVGDPSEDGRLLAVPGTDTTGQRGIYVIDIETGETSRVFRGAGVAPRFSKDGTTIALWLNRELFTVPVSGGSPVKVAENASRTVAWLEDQSLLYTSAGVLWLLPADGSEARRVTEPDSSRIHEPAMLPGDRLALICALHQGETRERLEIVDLQTGQRTPIGFGTRPRYLSSGHLIYGDPENQIMGPLFVRPFSLSSREFVGSQKAVFDQAPVWLYEMDGYGTLYHRLFESVQIGRQQVSIVSQPLDGSASSILVSGTGLEWPRVEPSGRRVAVTVEAGDDYLMIYDPESDVKQQITFSGDEDYHAWSADGERILLERKGPLEIWSTRGSGLLETLPIDDAATFDWSLDGRWIVHDTRVADGLWLYDIETERDTLLEPLDAYHPSFSPDGEYVAYTLDTGNGITSAVRSRDGETVVRLSLGGIEGREPRWSPDGRSLFVRTERDIVRVPVTTTDGFAQSGPAETVLTPAPGRVMFDVSADDTVYYSTNAVGDIEREGGVVRVVVVMNWFEQIKQLAPPSQ